MPPSRYLWTALYIEPRSLGRVALPAGRDHARGNKGRGAMVNLIRDISTKSLLQATPGELVKIDAGSGFYFGVVLAIDAKPPIVGFLQPTGRASIPVYRRLPDRKCISFGKNWAIEANPDEATVPGNSNFQNVSGALFVAGADVIVCFQPGQESYDSTEVYFNLTTRQFENSYPRELAAPFLNWRIWASKEEYLRPGAKPLIDVNTTGVKPV